MYYKKEYKTEDGFVIKEQFSQEKERRIISIEKFAQIKDKSVEDIIDGDYDEIQAYVPPALSAVKAKKIAEIDGKTRELLAGGFEFDSIQFSLSLPSQMNWSEIHSNQSDFSDPEPISTIDHDTYNLVASDIEAFWLAGKNAVSSALKSGRDLKKSVLNALTNAEVDAVSDER